MLLQYRYITCSAIVNNRGMSEWNGAGCKSIVPAVPRAKCNTGTG